MEAGISATRRSRGKISLGTPTIMLGPSCWPWGTVVVLQRFVAPVDRLKP
jgi:hypothetical protein